jgi:Flp pilus assembly pilin Flp
MTSLWRSLKAADLKVGQAMVEYALILCLVVVVLVVIVMLLGNQVQNLYCNISGGLNR